MLTVLADDITGAAEIAGVCLRSGLRVKLDFDFSVRSVPEAEVWVIASDTRSLAKGEASEAVRETARVLRELGVGRLYKKIDSALRGHVVAEIEALRKIFSVEKVVVLPGNPSGGRVVCDGVYLIDGRRLDETSFADDPDFPARTAVVRDLLGLDDDRKDYVTPDVTSAGDYNLGAIPDGTLPAGGSAFFEACLPVWFPNRNLVAELPESTPPEGPMLMICGSAHANSRAFIRGNRYFRTLAIPRREVGGLLRGGAEAWVEAAGAALERGRTLVSVGCEGEEGVSAGDVKRLLVDITQALVRRYPVRELLIEGGATAYGCMRAGGWASLLPVTEYARGVVRMKVLDREDLYLTIKPGSYEWPEKLFQA
jgi:uncharacterized protein YgbK (DUF1537 family)